MISRQYLEKSGGHTRRTSSTSEDLRPATAMTQRPISAITTTVEEDVFDTNLKEKQSDPPKCKFFIFFMPEHLSQNSENIVPHETYFGCHSCHNPCQFGQTSNWSGLVATIAMAC